MRAESIDDVQATIFKDVLGFEDLPFLAQASASNVGVGLPSPAARFVDPVLLNPLTARQSPAAARLQQDVALGMAPGTGSGDVRLAVLVQSREVLESDAVEQIRRIASDECDVVFIGRQEPLWTKLRQRPMKMGASIAPAAYEKRGTTGFFARNSAGRVVAVSNNHVLAGINRFPIGTRILQQASKDGGTDPADAVGTLSNYIPLQFGGVANAVDAACAEVDDSVQFDHSTIYGTAEPPAGVGTVDFSAITDPQLEMEVLKTGRTTGHTTGLVRFVNVNNYTVNMMPDTPGYIARFDGQIMFRALTGSETPFSSAGDSGSLICDAQGRPVAMLFSGTRPDVPVSDRVTGGNPIASVLSQLGLTFL
jgi:hypothetical protein